MKSAFSLAIAMILFVFPSPVFAADTVDKTICKLAVGYQDVDEIKADLLVGVKREVINELFGEMIVASTAVENFVVTSDQIRVSSIGFVRVEGNANFFNGKGFAEVCVTIHAYVTDEDKAKFDPERLGKKYCDADDDLTTAQLIAYVKDEAVIQALTEYNPKLKGADKDSLLQLVQKVTYLESGFISDTQTYCAKFEGFVVPVEVTAFLEMDSSAPPTISTIIVASGTHTEYRSQEAWRPAALAQTNPLWPSLPGANWVWKTPLVTLAEARTGSGVVTFRQVFTIPFDARNIVGNIRITADNGYELSLNGAVIGKDGTLDVSATGGDLRSIEDYRIDPRPGKNELAIKVINYDMPESSDPIQNPGGVLFLAEITYN